MSELSVEVSKITAALNRLTGGAIPVSNPAGVHINAGAVLSAVAMILPAPIGTVVSGIASILGTVPTTTTAGTVAPVGTTSVLTEVLDSFYADIVTTADNALTNWLGSVIASKLPELSATQQADAVAAFKSILLSAQADLTALIPGLTLSAVAPPVPSAAAPVVIAASRAVPVGGSGAEIPGDDLDATGFPPETEAQKESDAALAARDSQPSVLPG